MTLTQNNERTESLLSRINQNQLTKNRVNEFLAKNKVVVKHDIDDINDCFGALSIISGKFSININKVKPKREREITLVHELSHAIYGVYYYNHLREQETVKEIIEAESQRFYRENTPFVRALYSAVIPYKEFNQLEFSYLTNEEAIKLQSQRTKVKMQVQDVPMLEFLLKMQRIYDI